MVRHFADYPVETQRNKMQALTISRAAQIAGVGVETIRFYERRGLIEH